MKFHTTARLMPIAGLLLAILMVATGCGKSGAMVSPTPTHTGATTSPTVSPGTNTLPGNTPTVSPGLPTNPTGLPETTAGITNSPTVSPGNQSWLDSNDNLMGTDDLSRTNTQLPTMPLANDPNYDNTTNDASSREEAIEKFVERLAQVDHCRAVIVDNVCLLGLELKEGNYGFLGSSVAMAAQQRAKDVDHSLTRVVATFNPDLVSKIATLHTRVTNNGNLNQINQDFWNIANWVMP